MLKTFVRAYKAEGRILTFFQSKPDRRTSQRGEDPEGNVPEDGRGPAEVVGPLHSQGHQDLAWVQGDPQRISQARMFAGYDNISKKDPVVLKRKHLIIMLIRINFT